MDEMHSVFTAMADGTRRSILDSLYAMPGQNLNQLSEQFSISRQGVAKHLKILEEAELVITLKRGREKLQYLNPVPVRKIYQRWIRKFEEDPSDALINLKIKLEQPPQEQAAEETK